MKKLAMHSKDLTQENLAKIQAAFPNCITESKDDNGNIKLSVDFDLLRQELADHIVEGPQERYRLDWPGKREAMLAANAPIAKTLRPAREDSVDFDNTENLFIEGDNLEALKLLQENYLGKVKMIYIDPPYNTGNDFVYNDDFAENSTEYFERSNQVDEEGNRLVANTDSNGRFHSDWLSMMLPRLKLARNLLSDDGVIFISIDDNEQATLKKLCDEVFSENNFIGQITVVGNPRGRDYGGVAKMHDYILCYRKTIETKINLVRPKEERFKMFDSLGGFELRELRNRNVKFNKENRPNLYYSFYVNPEQPDEHGLHEISLDKKNGWLELPPIPSQGVNVVWRWGKSKSLENLNVNIMAKPMRNGSFMIVEKYRQSKVMARSVWWDTDTNTEKGTLTVKALMSGKFFDYPKPVELISRLIEMGANNSEGFTVLDLFAGSSTTAHAVMQLNSEDGGNRKFIMVQLPEAIDEEDEAFKEGYKTIVDLSKERIRRAGQQILEGECHEDWNKDVGFRVLKVDTSNMKDVYYRPQDISQETLFDFVDNIKDDRTSEDLLFQVLLESAAELNAPIRRETIQDKEVFFVNDNDLIACFDNGITEALINELATHQPLRVVFRDSGFADNSVKTNVSQIFKQLSEGTEVRSI